MFKLFRRISYGVIQRPDRPWEEDATSCAPAPAKKRRFSSMDVDPREEDAEEIARKKRMRDEGSGMTPDRAVGYVESSGSRETPMPLPESETQEVKEVTEGVKVVALNAEEVPVVLEVVMEDVSTPVVPESVPLPSDVVSGELEESAEDSPKALEAADPIEAPSLQTETVEEPVVDAKDDHVHQEDKEEKAQEHESETLPVEAEETEKEKEETPVEAEKKDSDTSEQEEAVKSPVVVEAVADPTIIASAIPLPESPKADSNTKE